MTIELYPHQSKAVDEMHNGCILWGGVGSGKTITSLAYFYTKVCGGVLNDMGSMRRPIDIYVITTAKKRDSLDWQKEAAKLGIGRTLQGTTSDILLTVDSWNNIDKYKDVSDAFFIFDEQRVVGSGTWTKAFIKIAKLNKWVLLSATPGDTWLDYIPVFVANGFYKNRTEFKREHVVYNNHAKFPKVERYLNTSRLVRQRNQILIKMPYFSHTTRHSEVIKVSYNKEQFEKVVKERWHVYENRPLRDVAELFVVMRKVVNTDPTRLSALMEVLSEHPRVIVFYNFDYELEILRSLASTSSESTTNGKAQPTASIVGTVEPSLRKQERTSDGQTLKTPSNSSKQSSKSSSRRGKRTTSTTFVVENDLQPTIVDDTAGFQIAEWNGHKHEPIPKTDRWVYLVQYMAGAEGWNCVDTNAMVFYSQTYSYKMFHQAHGRIDRLNTPHNDLYYYSLVSDAVIDKAIQKSLKAKKNFNESSFSKNL